MCRLCEHWRGNRNRNHDGQLTCVGVSKRPVLNVDYRLRTAKAAFTSSVSCVVISTSETGEPTSFYWCVVPDDDVDAAARISQHPHCLVNETRLPRVNHRPMGSRAAEERKTVHCELFPDERFRPASSFSCPELLYKLPAAPPAAQVPPPPLNSRLFSKGVCGGLTLLRRQNGQILCHSLIPFLILRRWFGFLWL